MNVYFIKDTERKELVVMVYVTDCFRDAWHLFHKRFNKVSHTIWPDSASSCFHNMNMTIESNGTTETKLVSEFITEVEKGRDQFIGRLISLSLDISKLELPQEPAGPAPPLQGG